MSKKKVLVTGGAGYVGSLLVPYLIEKGFSVTVLDWYLYKKDVFKDIRSSLLTEIVGDLRNVDDVNKSLIDVNYVIHLACISNDPSAELNSKLSIDVNQNGFKTLLDCCVDRKVEKFIFASSSSVYGISESPKVTESHPRIPVSLYNITKAWCEDLLINEYKEFPYVIVRPATICGYSKRLRLDLSVNLLTSHGIKRKKINVFGGDQYRPNLNIKDMINFYYFLLTEEYEKFNHEIFNISYKNYKIMEIAEIIKDQLKSKVGNIEINVTKSNDPRSYRVNCEKLESVGFKCRFGIEDAVDELFQAFESNLISSDITGTEYNNVKMMLKKEII